MVTLLPRSVTRRCWRYTHYFLIFGLCFFVFSLYFSASSSKSENLPSKQYLEKSGDSKRIYDAGSLEKMGFDENLAKEESLVDSQVGVDESERKKDGYDPFVKYRDLPKKDWHDYKAMENDKLRQGPGEQGSPVALPSDPETKKKQDAIYRVNGFDGLASDKIALNRSIKDIRHEECKKKQYISKLPSVTVVVPFHEEHWSTLLRTVYSVYERSPKGVLKQIILVDDFSQKEFLKQQLDDYLKTNFKKNFVKVVRTKKREGLIRAREIGGPKKSTSGFHSGAEHVKSEITVFLDSHSEPSYNWLPPLVEPIALNYRTVVCPFVDVIDCDTFEYRAQDEGGRGSFDWEFSYKRLPLLPGDRSDPTKPFRSPVMAGGYFAISTKWFWELGGYDEGLDIWGGEQYELSFKVWQCHGEMVDAPCSRVGHIYRCKHVPFPNPGVGDFISRNYKRVAEVWMDEYKENLYKRRPVMRDTDAGDLTKQLEVRRRLKCKPFKWFMEEIMFDQEKFYPAVEPPDGAFGELRNDAAQKCVDTQFRGKDERFELRKCMKDDPGVGGEQKIRYTWWKDIRADRRSMCFDVSTSVKHAPIVLFPCHGMQGNQEWRLKFDTRQLYHPISNMCLDCDSQRGELFMSDCDKNSQTQKWKWESLNQTVIQSWK